MTAGGTVEPVNGNLITQGPGRPGMEWRHAGGQAIITPRAPARSDRAWETLQGNRQSANRECRATRRHTGITPHVPRPPPLAADVASAPERPAVAGPVHPPRGLHDGPPRAAVPGRRAAPRRPSVPLVAVPSRPSGGCPASSRARRFPRLRRSWSPAPVPVTVRFPDPASIGTREQGAAFPQESAFHFSTASSLDHC